MIIKKMIRKLNSPKETQGTSVETQKGFDYENAEVILDVRHVKQFFRFGSGIYKYNKAVNDVSFKVYKGEVFGLVGESGCGKTTLGRSIIKLYKITSGDVWFKDERISAGTRWNEKEIKYTRIRLEQNVAKLKLECKEKLAEVASRYKQQFEEDFDLNHVVKYYEDETPQYKFVLEYTQVKNHYDEEIKRITSEANEIISVQREKIKLANEVNRRNVNITDKIQMIFQDPIASLNPRMTVRDIISEGLVIRGVKDKEYIASEVNRVLELVGLVPEHANRYPHEFSGGQRQRIGIARAIIMNPELIIADEPVSALDVSIQAQVINLLNDLRTELGLTVLFIAHNLSVVKYFCDRIAVMYYGKIVELATSEELFKNPLHPYTKSLLSAVPHPDPNIERNRVRITYDANKAHNYIEQKPTLREIAPGHFVHCDDVEFEKYLKEIKA